MIFSILIGIAIFGYTAWALVRFFQKSKEGVCAGCSQNENCTVANACCSGMDVKEGSSKIS